MPNDLTGARHKLDRANKHRKLAKKLMWSFIRRNCKAVPELDVDPKWTNIKAVLPMPPHTVALIIGDCLYNLRSALDHVVYQFVISNPARPAGTPNIRTMFPVRDTEAGWKGADDRLAGVPDPICTLIDQAQPYKARNAGEDYTLNPFWVLDRLENIDKHRRLALITSNAIQARTRITDLSGIQPEAEIKHTGGIRDGAIIGGYSSDANVHVSGYISSFVAFNESDELPSLVGGDVNFILRSLAEAVDQFIVRCESAII
jgi:hypothetical protein